LLDRIDIHIEVPHLRQDQLMSEQTGEASLPIRDRVRRAREVQQRRFEGLPIYCNAHMQSKQLKTFCPIDEPVKDLLKGAIHQLNLSARAYDRILKLSRTIADLAGLEQILPNHVAEAVQYRSLDRKLWG